MFTFLSWVNSVSALHKYVGLVEIDDSPSRRKLYNLGFSVTKWKTLEGYYLIFFRLLDENYKPLYDFDTMQLSEAPAKYIITNPRGALVDLARSSIHQIHADKRITTEEAMRKFVSLKQFYALNDVDWKKTKTSNNQTQDREEDK